MAGAVSTPVVFRLLGLFPENHDPTLFPLLVAFKGLSYCMSMVMVISISSTIADVTDEHELITGRRQEGVFFAARAFFGKLTSGLGHLIAGIGIDLIAFPVNATPGTIEPETLFAFGVLAGPVTALPALISIFFYLRYNIDETRHKEIRAALEGQSESADGGGP
jgi:Na+/melibiose symporter-like transporter